MTDQKIGGYTYGMSSTLGFDVTVTPEGEVYLSATPEPIRLSAEGLEELYREILAWREEYELDGVAAEDWEFLTRLV